MKDALFLIVIIALVIMLIDGAFREKNLTGSFPSWAVTANLEGILNATQGIFDMEIKMPKLLINGTANEE